MIEVRNRLTLIGSFPRNAAVAEIGVDVGGFATEILTATKPKSLHLIDCWKHQPVAVYGHDPANCPDEIQETRYHEVIRRFADNPVVTIHRAYSLDAVASFPDSYFDWIYFDANHLQLRADLEAWCPKVKVGGWISGHDYCVWDDFIIVKPVVDHVVREYGLSLHVTSEKLFPSWAFQKSATLFRKGNDS